MEDIETDSEEWEDDDDEALAPTSCMFCKQSSASIEESVRHMADAHSFFIPDVEFVVDLEGLLTYIGERIGQGRICLWCGHLGRQFPSTDAVQKHMLDKGHCKMFHEGEVRLTSTSISAQSLLSAQSLPRLTHLDRVAHGFT